MAKKHIGAMMLLNAKKYCTWSHVSEFIHVASLIKIG